MKTKCIALVLALGITGLTQAAVSPEEAKQLDTTLTSWGAIKAGNKEGTIPPYEGGLPATTAPAGFIKDSGHYPDPFANEKPLYSITAKNMDQYLDKLSEVTKEMLMRFPATYRLNVYPTHRIVNYPQYFIDNSLKNATRCKTIEDGLALSGCIGGVPFPIPKTGNQQMWNVATAFRPPVAAITVGIYVDAAGSAVTSVIQDAVYDSPYYNPKETVESFEKSGGSIFRGTATTIAPPRIAGDGTLIRWYANPVSNPSKGWQYQQGNRRILTIPDAQYDYPLLPSGGAQFFDEVYLYSGKQDRFDFKHLGTKEMIIPYDCYRAAQATKEDITSVGGGRHPNPAVMRWELHRVVVVEATLKEGMRHTFLKRRFYMDEDMPAMGMADAWGHNGKLYRGYFGLTFWAYDKQAPITPDALEFDLPTGIWYVNAQLWKKVKVLDQYLPDSFYTPEGLARRSQR